MKKPVYVQRTRNVAKPSERDPSVSGDRPSALGVAEAAGQGGRQRSQQGPRGPSRLETDRQVVTTSLAWAATLSPAPLLEARSSSVPRDQRSLDRARLRGGRLSRPTDRRSSSRVGLSAIAQPDRAVSMAPPGSVPRAFGDAEFTLASRATRGQLRPQCLRDRGKAVGSLVSRSALAKGVFWQGTTGGLARPHGVRSPLKMG